MEGTQQESELENEAIFVWRIPEFLEPVEPRLLSPVFSDREGHTWQLLGYPGGNGTFKGSFSLYIVLAQTFEGKDWAVDAHMEFAVLHPSGDGTRALRNETRKLFHGQDPDSDWGYNQYALVSKLKSDGYIDRDGSLRVRVRVVSQVRECDYRQALGCVGLLNQGATCYLNSLLQALFHVGAFRKAVYSVQDGGRPSIAQALQRLFVSMQRSDRAPSTKELTQAFGWTRADSFIQHDVQELSRVLCDALESGMKGSPAEHAIDELFQGRLYNYVRCKHVPYESTREETFLDVSLNVHQIRDLNASLADYVAVEELNGSNQYDAGEAYGKQDAQKGTAFWRLPPVLQLHLKRFVYDWSTDTMRKVHDRFEYPEFLDMSPYLHPNSPDRLSELPSDTDSKPIHPPIKDEPGKERESSETRLPEAPSGWRTTRYRLYCVLVHLGDVHAGHYYAYVRRGERWTLFDDTHVEPVARASVLDANFGSSMGGPCAYMLMYVREADTGRVFAVPELPSAPVPAQGMELESPSPPSAETLSLRYVPPGLRSAHPGLDFSAHGFGHCAFGEALQCEERISGGVSWKALKRHMQSRADVGVPPVSMRQMRFWVVPVGLEGAPRLVPAPREDRALLEDAEGTGLRIWVERAPCTAPLAAASLPLPRSLLEPRPGAYVLGGKVGEDHVVFPEFSAERADVLVVVLQKESNKGTDGLLRELGSMVVWRDAPVAAYVPAVHALRHAALPSGPRPSPPLLWLWVGSADALQLRFVTDPGAPWAQWVPASHHCVTLVVQVADSLRHSESDFDPDFVSMEEHSTSSNPVPAPEEALEATVEESLQKGPPLPSSGDRTTASTLFRWQRRHHRILLKDRAGEREAVSVILDERWSEPQLRRACASALSMDADVLRLCDAHAPYREVSGLREGVRCLAYERRAFGRRESEGMAELAVGWVLPRRGTRERAVVDVQVLVPSAGATLAHVERALRVRAPMEAPQSGALTFALLSHHVYEDWRLPSDSPVPLPSKHRRLVAEEADRAVPDEGRTLQLVHVSPNGAPFGVPELFVARPLETWADAKRRIRKQLELSDDEFARWRLGLRMFADSSTFFLEDDAVCLLQLVLDRKSDILAMHHRDPRKREKNLGILIQK